MWLAIAFLALPVAAEPTADAPAVERLFLDDVDASGEGWVRAWVRAETRAGMAVPGLTAEDFVLVDNGSRFDPDELRVQPGTEVAAPVAWVLVLNNSRRLKGAPLDAAREAAIGFAAALPPDDRLAVVTYGGGVRIVADFEVPRREVQARLAAVALAGDSLATVLYDSIDAALGLLAETADLPRRHAIAVLSDGRDSDSQRGLDEIVGRSRGDELRPRTPVFAVGYSRFGGRELDKLVELTTATGGSLRHATSPEPFARYLAEIIEQARGAYRVEFAGDLDGELHRVEIRSAGRSDSRTHRYPDRRVARWPWIVILLALAGGAGYALSRRRARTAALVFVGGADVGRKVFLHGRVITLGSLSENDIVIPSDAASRRHARIVQDPDEVKLEDLDSSNGTFVNGNAIRRARLHPGDRIRIGDVELVYHQ
ncbi:MAG: FHA domain-containing protein [Proteobacteria bacterium]|nr:FHA domain-containing protein [Pseudomonadota bacterium]